MNQDRSRQTRTTGRVVVLRERRNPINSTSSRSFLGGGVVADGGRSTGCNRRRKRVDEGFGLLWVGMWPPFTMTCRGQPSCYHHRLVHEHAATIYGPHNVIIER